jgi:ribonuclease D
VRYIALEKSASHDVIASEQKLADLIRQIQAAGRVAIDTEADSLHSYREKLCLVQISVPSAVIESVCDFIVDPLCNLDLEPLRHAFESREIVLHCRRLRSADASARIEFHREQNFRHSRCARLLGIREFSLGALVKRFLRCRASQTFAKANWALRPLPHGCCNTRWTTCITLLPLAAKLKKSWSEFNAAIGFDNPVSVQSSPPPPPGTDRG